MTHPPCQGIPDISTLPWFTLFTPYICLLVIRGTRDLVDDIVSGVREHLGRGRGGRAEPFSAATRDRCPMALWSCHLGGYTE